MCKRFLDRVVYLKLTLNALSSNFYLTSWPTLISFHRQLTSDARASLKRQLCAYTTTLFSTSFSVFHQSCKRLLRGELENLQIQTMTPCHDMAGMDLELLSKVFLAVLQERCKSRRDVLMRRLHSTPITCLESWRPGGQEQLNNDKEVRRVSS
jgi:hypothetical protein